MSRKQNLLRNLQELGRIEPEAAETERAIERARSAMGDSKAEGRRSLTRFIRPRILAPLGAAAAIIFLVTEWILTGSNSIAFAQVQEQVAKSKSVQYAQQWIEKNSEGETIFQTSTRVRILGDKLKREERDLVPNSPMGASFYTVRDLNQGKWLVVYPDVKAFGLTRSPPGLTDAYMPATDEPQPSIPAPAPSNDGKNTWRPNKLPAESPATGKLTEIPSTNAAAQEKAGNNDWIWDASASVPKLKPLPQLDIFELIRHVPSDQAKRLPSKTIDGKNVVGFVVEQTEKNQFGTTIWQHTWWVDPNTKLPVRMEVNFRGDDPHSGSDERIISSIVFDAPLDPALFSVDPPKGYRDLESVAREINSGQSGNLPIEKPPFVFEEVAKELAKVKSVQYVQTGKSHAEDGRLQQESVIHVFLAGDDRIRKEIVNISWPLQKVRDESHGKDPAVFSEYRSIFVQDLKQGKRMSVNTERKEYSIDKAIVLPPFTKLSTGEQPKDSAKVPATSTGNFHLVIPNTFPTTVLMDEYERIKYVADNTTKKLPPRMIDGKKVVGFRVEEIQEGPSGTQTWTRNYWIDPSTKLPVRVEVAAKMTGQWSGDMDTTISDFVFDAPLNPALFSLKPPAGYKNLAEQEPPDEAAPEAEMPAKTEFVFEEVRKEVEKAKTVQYVELRKDSSKNGDSKSEVRSKVMVFAPAIERREVSRSPGSVIAEEPYIMINDMRRGKLITLFPEKKSYSTPNEVLAFDPDMHLQTGKIKPEPKADIYNQFRQVEFDKAKRLPEKIVDGRKAIGFSVEEKRETQTGVDTFQRTYWVDPKTKLPIRIEGSFRSTKPFMGDTDWVFGDFLFDAPLDEKLFSLAPPEGYTNLAEKKSGAESKDSQRPAP